MCRGKTEESLAFCEKGLLVLGGSGGKSGVSVGPKLFQLLNFLKTHFQRILHQTLLFQKHLLSVSCSSC